MTMENMELMDKPHRIPVNLRFTREHFEKLTKSLDPEDMEDKWLIYTDGRVIHCHRSWTGYETYRAELQPVENGGYVITEILAERNAEKYKNTNDERDAELFPKLIAYLALEVGVNEIQGEVA